jgi:hypothetical protein
MCGWWGTPVHSHSLSPIVPDIDSHKCWGLDSPPRPAQSRDCRANRADMQLSGQSSVSAGCSCRHRECLLPPQQFDHLAGRLLV